MINGKRIAVAMPASNAEKTLQVTVGKLPEFDDIRILVDDHSRDHTVDLVRQFGTAMARIVAYDVYDVILGSRIIGGRALLGGMPVYKYIANRLLTAFENLFLEVKLSEYHTGYRAFSRKVPSDKGRRLEAGGETYCAARSENARPA